MRQRLAYAGDEALSLTNDYWKIVSIRRNRRQTWLANCYFIRLEGGGRA
jgi:hypothetical protein